MNGSVDIHLKVDRMKEFDLRVRAAELDGYTDIEWCEVSVPWLMDLVEENWSGIKNGNRVCLPEYTKDWNAAGALLEKLKDMEKYPELQNVGIRGHMWNLWLDDGANSEIIAQDESAKIAITKAFIIAREEDE